MMAVFLSCCCYVEYVVLVKHCAQYTAVECTLEVHCDFARGSTRFVCCVSSLFSLFLMRPVMQV